MVAGSAVIQCSTQDDDAVAVTSCHWAPQEGETADAGVLALRARQMRNLMLALMVAQGTPMVLMGAPPSTHSRPAPWQKR